jgi:hypothetical protein
MKTLADPAVFQPHANTKFQVHAPDRVDTVTLSSVATKIDDEIQLCFVLHFTGTGKALPQGIYRMTHEAMGEIELFIVPIHTRKPGLLYEAAFNLLKDEQPASL